MQVLERGDLRSLNGQARAAILTARAFFLPLTQNFAVHLLFAPLKPLDHQHDVIFESPEKSV